MFVNAEVEERIEGKRELLETTKSKILVVDDNEELLSVIKDLLGFHGYQVITCSEVNQAIEIFNHTIPDLILCDVLSCRSSYSDPC